MKSALTIILAAVLFSFGNTQVASLLNEAQEDAAFLESGFESDCYKLQFGEVELTGDKSEMTTDDVKSMLASSYNVKAGDNCAAAGSVEHMELQFDYQSGASYTMTNDRLGELQSAEIGERLIVNLTRVTVKSVRFKDAEGVLQSLPDHVITIK